MNERDEQRLDNLLRHINNVREDCVLLGQRLMEAGEKIGLQLIANGHVHDASKFRGIEWEYLNDGAWPFENDASGTRLAACQLALHQHQKTNKHHPEYWDDIAEMPRVYMAEMVCDWHARSSEQGTDLLAWVKEKATEKYRFPTCGRVYKELKEFIDLLLERRFK